MQRFFTACFLTILIISLVSGQQLFNGDDEKLLIKKEIERYRSTFNAQSATLADNRIDVKYYNLNITVTTSPQYLHGVVEMKAVALQDGLTSVTLDLMNSFTVDSVILGGSGAGIVQHSSTFDITLDRIYNTGELIQMSIYYRGIPGNSGFGSFEFSSHSGTPWVWSLSEPYGAKDWWPCKDHPKDKADSADIIITTTTGYKVGSNGKLMSVVDNGNGTSTHHWKERYPIPTYLISIAITNYAQFSNWFHYSPTDSMEVLNYVLPENLASAQANLPRTVDMLEIYSDLFGLYPFIEEKYGHSQFGWGGGMEHQTMTSLGGFSEGLVAHELAHQWFGDMITCRDWPNIWMNEGFATYLTGLYYEQHYGSGSYWSYMNSEMSSAKNATGTIYVTDTNNIGVLFSGSLVYAKGATVLHMLRHVMGDSSFFDAMYEYANDPAFKYGTAVTEDFQAVCETISGMDLDYFFDEWIYGEKFPTYVVGWSVENAAEGFDVTVNVSQTTGTTNPEFFTMPIDIKLSTGDWDTTVVVFNNQQSQSFTINTSHQPTTVQLDPDNWILKNFGTSVSISPANLYIGVTYVGSSRTDSLTLTYSGFGTLNVTSAESDLSQFTVSPTSGSISGGGSMKFYVTFTPTGEGAKLGHIIINHNQGAANQVNVTAMGIYHKVSTLLSTNWNIVSLPLYPADSRKAAIFSGASSAAYAFIPDSGYVVKDTLANGIGYWIKYPTAVNVTFSGFLRSSDTVEVKTGWNLVGSLMDSINVSSVVSEPPGIIASPFFGYKSGYVVSELLKPASGYWVKVNENGVLILDGGLKK